MPLTLEQYCEEYRYKLIEKYVTLGGDFSDTVRYHTRAKVMACDGAIHYLHYDKSVKVTGYDKNTKTLRYSVRGWRNTTLERKERCVRKKTC